ncbi:RAD55 family ATPase [Sandarakinorhabdus sp. DWP1-3-1]|uniref:RAD55 family ATPase n=1 Tax=Sandarakinorhabdus sp. DWP1-3-1 TaxID=2804627 RepID=UPI003CF14680
MNHLDQARLSTGIEGLDQILGGGLVPGCAYIVQGPPGAGKTILANQVCFHVALEGKRSLYVSLLAESHDRMLGHMSTLDFFDRAAVPDAVTYISGYATLASERLAGLLRLIHDEVRRHKASVLVLDGLFVASDSASSEQEFRAFVHDLQGSAALYGCTFLILTNQTRDRGAPEHTMVDGGIELLDEMHGARSIRTVIVRKQRGTAHVRGRHQYRITDSGLQVFPRLEAVLSRIPADAETTTRVTTGIDAFDTMIGGGYPVGSSSVLAGPSGTGKTTMGLQFLSRSTPEEPGLLFGLYETPARLRTKARSIGIDIDGLVASGALEIIWQPPAENLSDELGYKLLEAVERRQVKRVFFDGMGPLRRAFVFPERLPLAINAINNRLRELHATVVYSLELPSLFMPEEVSKDELSSMVENVILTYFVKPSNERDGSGRAGVVNRELLVLKIRDSAFDAYPEIYHITSEGMRFGGIVNNDLRPHAAVGDGEAE